MANLPSNRTKLQSAISDQSQSITPASGKANREAMIEAYDTIDLLNQKVDNLVPVGAVTPAPPTFMSRQAVINGNFDIPQRGAIFTNPASNQYTLDRWKNAIDGNGGTLPTLVHSQLSLTPGDLPGSSFAYRLNTNGSGTNLGASSYHNVSQYVENGTRYLCGAGKKVTLSFYVRSDIPGKRIGVRFYQGYGTGGSPSATEAINGKNFTLTPNLTKYTVTIDTNSLAGKTFGTNNDDAFVIEFWYMWGADNASSVGTSTAETFGGAGNVDIAQVQHCAGDTALPFQPKTYVQELNDCLWFCWKPSPGVWEDYRAVVVTQNSITFNLPIRMRKSGSVLGVENNDIKVLNASNLSGQTGFTFSVVATSSGIHITATKAAHGLTDAVLEISPSSGIDAEY